MSKLSQTKPGHRYPGYRPFEDNEFDRLLFFGRKKEIRSFLYKVNSNRLVILFARSGLGKTSLINAGLKQALRDKDYVPLTIRLNSPDIDPIESIYRSIKQIAEQEQLDYEQGKENTLWEYFKTVAFWRPGNKFGIPVLILDQFEEFFLLHSHEKRQSFIKQMADLINNNIPDDVLKSVKSEEPFPYSDRPPNVKIIISIREDYLGNLDEMLTEIPGILNNRLRLLPLNAEQAKEAINEPARVKHDQIESAAFSFRDETVVRILDFLCRKNDMYECKKPDEIESFELQLLCCHIEEHILPGKAKIAKGDIIIEPDDLGDDKAMRQVLEKFYEDVLEQFEPGDSRNRIRKLCEEGLISDSGLRPRKPQEEIKSRFKVSEGELAQLIDYRLIRSEPWGNVIYYELIHDTLIEPIREFQRKQQAQFELINKLSEVIKDDNADKPVAYEKVALEYIKNGSPEKAVEIYRQIVNFYPGYAGIYENIANALMEKDEKILIEKLYGYVLGSGSRKASLYITLGYQYYKIKNYKAAAAALQKALELDPENISTKINLAENFFLAEEFEKAHTLAKELSEIADIPAAEKLAAYFISAASLLFLGKKDDAETQMKIEEDFLNSLPADYEKSWNYQEIENFIRGSDKLTGDDSDWLLRHIPGKEPSKKEG